MRSTLSVGYAIAKAELKNGSTLEYSPELMISLQILD
jgi:hypothetical protein